MPQPAVRRILLVAPNMSRHMGGEALKALQIHLELRAMGYEVRQVTHDRVRTELTRDYPDLRVDYGADSPMQMRMNALGLGQALAFWNAWQLHRVAERVAAEWKPDIVHFTAPISPVLPRFRFPGQPMVIGPINGNVTHPPAFRDRETREKAMGARLLWPAQTIIGGLFRGKRDALLLVSGGERTERALRYAGCRPDRMIATLDSGIPDALLDRAPLVHDRVNHRFVFLGRLVRYKGCDLALRALAAAAPETRLDVIGDGGERAALEALAASLGVADRVAFLGWVKPGEPLYQQLAQYRALVMPSLAEANGIAFQEAMVLGLPVICVDWAGPQELLSGNEAVMIAPTGEAEVVAGVAAAMDRLATDPAAAGAMAARARDRAIATGFRWRDLLGRWTEVYARAVAEHR